MLEKKRKKSMYIVANGISWCCLKNKNPFAILHFIGEKCWDHWSTSPHGMVIKRALWSKKKKYISRRQFIRRDKNVAITSILSSGERVCHIKRRLLVFQTLVMTQYILRRFRSLESLTHWPVLVLLKAIRWVLILRWWSRFSKIIYLTLRGSDRLFC